MPQASETIIAVGLLTKTDLRRLGKGFDRWYPVDETPCFGELLAAIDEADRTLSRVRDKHADKMDVPATTRIR